jgi:hypothetical protein
MFFLWHGVNYVRSFGTASEGPKGILGNTPLYRGEVS